MKIMLTHSKNTNSPTEAFVYLWFDAKNRMFYLGKHKGHPDDNYTHSSPIMESFTKTTIPSYMHRRILATGTDQEMIDLENKLLDNRKEKCWDKYYNVTVAFPPPPMYGEDNPMWKGGVSKDPEQNRERAREYFKNNPEKVRASNRKWYANNADKKREYQTKYRAKNAEKLREYRAKNRDRIREQHREYQTKYRAKNAEKLREYHREYYAKNAEKLREHDRIRYAKKKAAGNSVDLTQFME